MKNDEIKSLVAQIEKKEIFLEDLLHNTDFIQPTIRHNNKFTKFIKFFTEKDWINKLIYYTLELDPILTERKDYEIISHNSAEILALVKHGKFVTEITKSVDSMEEFEEEINAIKEGKSDEIYNKDIIEDFEKELTKGRVFPYLNRIFNFLKRSKYLAPKIIFKSNYVSENLQIFGSKKMQIDTEFTTEEKEYSEEMLNGYFERVFLNLILKRKKKVIIPYYNLKLYIIIF
jgi:hypothetical protein